MNEEQEVDKNSETLDISELIKPSEEIKTKLGLALVHDGVESTTSYINSLMERFGKYFYKVFLVSEDEDNLDELDEYENVTIVSSLKPINKGIDWMLILDPNEYPSIQMINNMSEILSELDEKIKIVRFPIVICENGEITKIMSPASRLYKQNTTLFKSVENSEIVLDKYPIVKML